MAVSVYAAVPACVTDAAVPFLGSDHELPVQCVVC